MIDLSKYADIKYDDRSYNCLHFAVDIYKDLTGQDMGLFVDELMTDKDHRTINPSKLKNFTQIPTPISPCLAIMRGQAVHAGIYHSNAIIHLTEAGIQSTPTHIAQVQYGNISYYTIEH